MTLTHDLTPAELRLRRLLRVLAAFTGLLSLGVTFGIVDAADALLAKIIDITERREQTHHGIPFTLGVT
jgi:hypothetical protein